jgi:hypothetical protein
VPIDQAVAGLRDLAAGGGDLLAETAGVTVRGPRVSTPATTLSPLVCSCWPAPTMTRSPAGEHQAQEALR